MPVKKLGQTASYFISYSKYFLLNVYFVYYISRKSFQKFHQKMPNISGPPAPPWVAKRIGWFVYKSSRALPGSTCLSRALAARFALRRLGLAAEMHIGVAKEKNDYSAHAWLTSGDLVIVGNESNELDRYVEMSNVRGDAS